ncbi:MAG TPA: GAF domain-containing sensor histidine kinase [Anaerolineales bacterium]|nr:GAF domain-containing sensor histidine kinase [Anaerolineales bacterium]
MKPSIEASLLERYQRLAEISRDLASTLDLNALLNRIAHAAADLSQAEAASILLYDEPKQQLYFESSTNLDEPLMRGLTVPVEGSIAGLIVTSRQPIIISDTQNDPRHFGNIAKQTKVTTTSILGVPLIAKDKVIGALEAINKRAGSFNHEDQNVLMALGAQAAVAIENARLFQQSDLISEFVHELRTPLSSLNTAAHLLMRQDVSGSQRQRMVNIIQAETTRLSEMATAFLDLARLESGRVQFNAIVFQPRELLEECASMSYTRAQEIGLSLNLVIPGILPLIKADRDKIKQVLLNLISNALKYNRPGGEIIIRAEASTMDCAISIADTGPGIRSEDLRHLFEKFYRVQSSENVAPGTGLGLAICKSIVEAHDGQINIESEVGMGTTVTISLPLMKGS